MQSILGFHSDVLNTSVHAERVVDMTQGLNSLYVYTDVVQPRVVGDSLVPLLRSVPIKGKPGDMVASRFTNIHYVPLQHKEFSTVEIDIRDDTGRPISFERGKLSMTLHFRQKPRLL